MIDWQPGHWPQVGVGVFVIRDGKLLFGRRVGTHGHGVWCPPGGKLDPGETVEECAKRETEEETGLKIKNVRKASVFTDDHYDDEGMHFITAYALADAGAGEPRVTEPDKLVDWTWVSWGQLPEPLFLPIKQLREQNYRPPGV